MKPKVRFHDEIKAALAIRDGVPDWQGGVKSADPSFVRRHAPAIVRAFLQLIEELEQST